MSAVNWIIYAVTVAVFGWIWYARERQWNIKNRDNLRELRRMWLLDEAAAKEVGEKHFGDFHRTGLNKTLLALMLMAGAAWGQEWQPPKPGTMCGQRIGTAQTNSITIGCIDFDALAKLGVPGVYGQRMQVHIEAKYGDAVRVEAFYVDAEGKESSVIEWGDIRRNQDGSLGALVQFLGWEFTRVEVRVYRD